MEKSGHGRNSAVVVETSQAGNVIGRFGVLLLRWVTGGCSWETSTNVCGRSVLYKPALVCDIIRLSTDGCFGVPLSLCSSFCILWLIRCFYVLLGQQAVVPTTFMPECWIDSEPFNGVLRFCGFWLVFSIVIEERFTRFIRSPELPVQKLGCVFLDYSGQDEYFIVLVRFYIWMTTHP